MKNWIALSSIVLFILIGCKGNMLVDPIIPPVEKLITITSEAGSGGTIDPSGITNLKVGGTKTYKITPGIARKILSIKVNGVDQPISDTYTFINVLVDSKIKVEFAFLEYTITASVSSGGSITPAGATTVMAGDSLTYTIKPDSGYIISAIKVDGVDVAISNTYQFTKVSSDKKINVDFLSNDLFLLTKAPWYLKSMEFYADNDYLGSFDYSGSPESFTDKYYYRLKGTFIGVTYDYYTSGVGVSEVISAKGIIVGNGIWSLNGKTLTSALVGGRSYSVEELSEKVLILKTFLETLPNGKAKYQKTTFGRP